MTKTRVFYERTNPLEEGMDFVAIEKEGKMYVVFATYSTNGSGINGVPFCVRNQPNMVVVPVEQAGHLYDFEKIKDSRLGKFLSN